MNVVWMRQVNSQVAHAYADSDVLARPTEVDSVAWCGRVPLADLQVDELADRCSSCVHAAIKVQQR